MTGFSAPAIAVIGQVVDLRSQLAPASPVHSEHWAAVSGLKSEEIRGLSGLTQADEQTIRADS